MYKTVTRWNQSVPEAHVSEGGEKSHYGLLLSDSRGDMTQSVHILCQSLEGRTEQGALDSAVTGEHMQSVKNF